MLRQRGKQAHWGNTWDNARGAGAVNWVGRVQRRSWPFLVSQMSPVFQNKTSLLDSARISNNTYVRALVSRGTTVMPFQGRFHKLTISVSDLTRVGQTGQVPRRRKIEESIN
ncbi:hypothetical protein AVEN_134837-1 [Araneus ventricosus]|uniref:Uncharacterized protein n=1 Tax=Araneus ventricosus TaxID=182803 RepID=A0A4Y2N650_ARAVE|nr:hypothetical protein AVEN_134837-1 [Araneus ventricosus]